jgi:hypothetical protein
VQIVLAVNSIGEEIMKPQENVIVEHLTEKKLPSAIPDDLGQGKTTLGDSATLGGVPLKSLIDPGRSLIRFADEFFKDPVYPTFTSRLTPEENRARVGLELWIIFNSPSTFKEVQDAYLESPSLQYLCGGTFFCKELPFDEESVAKWRAGLSIVSVKALHNYAIDVIWEVKALELLGIDVLPVAPFIHGI